MTKIERLEKEIRALDGDELKAFLSLVDDLKWQLWEEQIERDSASGKLDWLIDEVEADIAAGRTEPL